MYLSGSSICIFRIVHSKVEASTNFKSSAHTCTSGPSFRRSLRLAFSDKPFCVPQRAPVLICARDLQQARGIGAGRRAPCCGARDAVHELFIDAARARLDDVPILRRELPRRLAKTWKVSKKVERLGCDAYHV